MTEDIAKEVRNQIRGHIFWHIQRQINDQIYWRVHDQVFGQITIPIKENLNG